MRPSRILILSLIVFLPDSSNQQNYRYDRYNYGQWKDVNYYDNYYKYTHNQPITGYYGFNYGNYGRGYNSRSLNGGYFRDYYDDYNPRRYQSYSPRSYYDEYYIRGQSYERPTGPYYDQQGYNYGQPPYDGYYRRYLLTRGWGFYGYYYNRSGRDYQPSAKNVDPFPGKFLGLGSVHYLRGSYDVELHCNFSKDGNKLVSNVVWVKVERAYRQISYGPPNVFVTNPYFCPAGGCIYRDIDTSDKRFFADMHGEVATLHIYDLEPRDYGVYRCSATAKASNGLPGDTEAIYEIVELFT